MKFSTRDVLALFGLAGREGGGGGSGVVVVPTLMSTIDKSPNVVTLKNKFLESSLRQGFNLLLC